jgi:hypothetical protein
MKPDSEAEVVGLERRLSLLKSPDRRFEPDFGEVGEVTDVGDVTSSCAVEGLFSSCAAAVSTPADGEPRGTLSSSSEVGNITAAVSVAPEPIAVVPNAAPPVGFGAASTGFSRDFCFSS